MCQSRTHGGTQFPSTSLSTGQLTLYNHYNCVELRCIALRCVALQCVASHDVAYHSFEPGHYDR